MRRGIRLSIFILFGIIALSCTETREISPDETGTRYFPLEVGNYIIYQVEGVKYINQKDSIPFSYQLKETVDESFQNLESGTSYKLLREIRAEENDDWQLDSVWTARKDESRAIRTENNVSFINLVFPLNEGKYWDGNGLNGKEYDLFEMINVGKSFEGNFNYYDKSVTIIKDYHPQNDVDNISIIDVYAKDIGLVYRQNISLKYLRGIELPEGCQYCGLYIIEEGLKYYQSIVDYGPK